MITPEFIDKHFINPTPIIGYDTYVIRKSIMLAVNDLHGRIHGNVVDLGCGIMPYRSYLQSSGRINHYIGIDMENSHYHNTITPDLYWDGMIIPLEDNTQDWVIITEFLEHYFDSTHILKEIKRILKPGGHIFFTIPSVYMLHEVPYDHHRFTPFSFQKILQLSGYKKSEIFPLGGFNFSLLIILGLWQKYAGGNRWYKIILSLFMRLSYRYLMKNDHGYSTFEKKLATYENYTMPSGLWGYAHV